jgi:hypothetical protein
MDPCLSSSVTQATGSSPSTVHANDKDDLSMFTSYRDMTGLDAYQELQELQCQGICYAGDKAIESLCEFLFNKDIREEVLVPKDVEGLISEFILSGIFQVDAHKFFMTSNGKWNSNNALSTRFEQVKPCCHLLLLRTYFSSFLLLLTCGCLMIFILLIFTRVYLQEYTSCQTHVLHVFASW